MTAVHTYVRDAAPDLFGDDAEAQHIEVRGRLLNDAEVRSLPIGDGDHVRPVLCMDLVPLAGNPLRRRMHAEQVYTESTRKEAELRAATLKRGTVITLRTTLVDMLTVFPHVQHVAISEA